MALPSNSKTQLQRVSKGKPSSLLGIVISDEGKKFHNIDTRNKILPSKLKILLNLWRHDTHHSGTVFTPFHFLLCCVETWNEENIGLVKSVYLMMIMVQIIRFVWERETGKNGVGREQEREKERKGLRVMEIECRWELRMAWVEKGTIEETPENDW